MAREIGVANSVFFAGSVKNPYPLLAHSAVLALSSRYEGFANVLAEALTLSIPIVSTDCDSGPREVLGDGHHGLLVRVDDPEGLAHAIETVLTKPELAAALRNRSAHAAAGLDSSIAAEKLIRLITKEFGPSSKRDASQEDNKACM
jgi:glycosyltransferase involved in cell wall biosynthesis